MEDIKKKLTAPEAEAVSGGEEPQIIFNDRGEVIPTLKPKDITLYTGDVIPDIITKDIPTI